MKKIDKSRLRIPREWGDEVSPQQIAAWLGCSAQCARNWIHYRDDFPDGFTRGEKLIRVEKRALRAWLRRQ